MRNTTPHRGRARHSGKLRRLALSALLAGLPLGVALAGPPGHGGRGPDGGRRLEALVERLGLDAEKRAAVDAVLDRAHARKRELRRELRDAHERMRTLLEAPEPDEAAILAHADAIGALETEVHKERLRTLLGVRALLSPAEREYLLEVMREHGPHRRRHRGGSDRPEAER